MTMQLIIDENLHNRFKLECVAKKRKMREVTEELIEAWLDQQATKLTDPVTGQSKSEAASILSYCEY